MREKGIMYKERPLLSHGQGGVCGGALDRQVNLTWNNQGKERRGERKREREDGGIMTHAADAHHEVNGENGGSKGGERE
jgi:hypothetical protein